MAANTFSAGDLTNIRSDGQFTRLRMAVLQGDTIFAAQVNQSFGTNDGVAQVTYDTVTTGAYTDIETGMLLYVGTVAGAYDKGFARIRKTPTATDLYLGEISEIAWADNLYLTVVADFPLVARHVRIDSGTVYMDYDVAYSDQNDTLDPVPVMGSHAIAELSGATVDVDFDASASWVLGSTISTYAWTAPGASASSGMTTATPTITYNAAGTYYVKLVLTAANGKTGTGYRKVHVWDSNNMPITQFTLQDCSGNFETGGWSFTVECFAEVTRALVRDRALVALFADDYYGATNTSVGGETNRENIIAWGWIDGETINWGADFSRVTFDVHGAQHWLSKVVGVPMGVEDVQTTPANWVEMQSLTVDKGLYHFLHWRATATAVMDVTLSGDGREVAELSAPTGSLWQQLKTMAYQTILAVPAVDRYGHLYVQIDSNLMPEADRSSIPVVQDIAKQDWRDEVVIQRNPTNDVGWADVSGVFYSGGTANAFCARSPGNVPFMWGGRVERLDRLALTGQAQATEIAGLLAGKRNQEYRNVVVPLASNHRGFDIAPHQYATMSLSASDTPRGVIWSTKKLIPRRVRFSYDHDAGVLLTDVEFEPYSVTANAIATTCPEAPTIDPLTAPSVTAPAWPGWPPDPVFAGNIVFAWDYEHGLAYSDDYFDGTPQWQYFTELPSRIGDGNTGTGQLDWLDWIISDGVLTVWALCNTVDTGTYYSDLWVIEDWDTSNTFVLKARIISSSPTRELIKGVAIDPADPSAALLLKGYESGKATFAYATAYGASISADRYTVSGAVGTQFVSSSPSAQLSYNSSGVGVAMFPMSANVAHIITTSDNGVTADSDNTISVNGASSWQRHVRAGDNVLSLVDRQNAFNDPIYKATDNGAGGFGTQQQNQNLGAIRTMPLNIHADGNYAMLAYIGNLEKSTGTTWSAATQPIDGSFSVYCVAPADPDDNQRWILGGVGGQRIWETTDFAATTGLWAAKTGTGLFSDSDIRGVWVVRS